MGRDLGSIYNELTVIKMKDLEECNKELNEGNHSSIIKKALITYKSELLESLEMYDHYLDV
ncbi:hypothetical protein NDK43_30295 [Neobacillus pocheonensis]|uniref:Uncharacterized protein n=1 Tax=Neobacillus pocheonensis TaxID=363869 RepID=A0ABT0WHI8_9BACI|nr:hypothetical protein [Neobacillus pocheonensis]